MAVWEKFYAVSTRSSLHGEFRAEKPSLCWFSSVLHAASDRMVHWYWHLFCSLSRCVHAPGELERAHPGVEVCFGFTFLTTALLFTTVSVLRIHCPRLVQ